MTTRPLVFIDTETTGLDPAVHEVVEVAWAVEDGPIESLALPHDFTRPDAKALALNGYLARKLFEAETWATEDDVLRLHGALKGATLVGANPRFDAAFLEAFFHRQSFIHDAEPWHYRLLDVQAYGMAALNLDAMPSLADLVRAVREKGFEVPESDHTAAPPGGAPDGRDLDPRPDGPGRRPGSLRGGRGPRNGPHRAWP
jgi:hypothetical protein